MISNEMHCAINHKYLKSIFTNLTLDHFMTIRHLIPTSLVLLIGFILSGCSNKQIYQSNQTSLANECRKIIEDRERERCFDTAKTSYDDYLRQKENKAP